MQHLRICLGGAAGALLPTLALAQGGDFPPSVLQGRASGWAAAIVVDQGPAQSGSQIRIKRAGNQTAFPEAAPAQLVGSSIPSYSLNQLHGNFPGIEIDAHSSGNGWIPPLNSNGVPALINRWLALTVSVSSSSQGANNSPWQRGSVGGRHAGSDLVSYYFDGSVGVTPILVGNIAQESSREDFGLATNSDSDIAALDYGMGVNTVAQTTSRLFNRQNDYYFSVSKAWADAWNTAHPTTPFATSPNSSTGHQPDGGAIYRLESTGTSWSSPVLYRSAAELGLGVGADLDALEVSDDTDMVIFSATIGSPFASNATTQVIGTPTQLMVFQGSNSPGANTVRELRHSSGQPNEAVGKRLKLGNQQQNEVDALCAIDPELGLDIDTNVGAPTAYWTAYGRPLGLSVVRRSVPNSDVDELVFQVTGWGQGTPVNGLIQLFKHVGPMGPGPYGIPSSGWSFEASAPRMASDQVFSIIRQRDLGVLSVEVETSFMAVLYDGQKQRVGASVVLTLTDHE